MSMKLLKAYSINEYSKWCKENTSWITDRLDVKCPVKIDESIREDNITGKYIPVEGITIYIRNIYKTSKSENFLKYSFIKTLVHECVHYIKGAIDRRKANGTDIFISETDCDLRTCTILKNIDQKDWEFHGVSDASLYITKAIMDTLAKVYVCKTRYKIKYNLTISKYIVDAMDILVNSVDVLSANFARNSTLAPMYMFKGGHE